MSARSFISAPEGPTEPVGQILTYYQVDERLGDVRAILDETRLADVKDGEAKVLLTTFARVNMILT